MDTFESIGIRFGKGFWNDWFKVGEGAFERAQGEFCVGEVCCGNDRVK